MDLMNSAEVRSILLEVGNQVKAEAEATAQDAQRGPGGELSGYAEAGFEVQYGPRGGRNVVKVVSLADPVMFTRVHFYSMKRYGVSHLRAALYKFTRRGA